MRPFLRGAPAGEPCRALHRRGLALAALPACKTAGCVFRVATFGPPKSADPDRRGGLIAPPRAA